MNDQVHISTAHHDLSTSTRRIIYTRMCLQCSTCSNRIVLKYVSQIVHYTCKSIKKNPILYNKCLQQCLTHISCINTLLVEGLIIYYSQLDVWKCHIFTIQWETTLHDIYITSCLKVIPIYHKSLDTCCIKVDRSGPVVSLTSGAEIRVANYDKNRTSKSRRVFLP